LDFPHGEFALSPRVVPYTIPAEPHPWRSVALSLLVHLALLAFLWVGVSWQSLTPTTVEAEIWDAVQRDAAPPPEPEPAPAPVLVPPKPASEPKPAPEPKRQEPKPPAPVVAPEPPKAKLADPDIALAQEKKRNQQKEKEQLAEEKQRREEESKQLAEEQKRQKEEQALKDKKKLEEEQKRKQEAAEAEEQKRKQEAAAAEEQKRKEMAAAEEQKRKEMAAAEEQKRKQEAAAEEQKRKEVAAAEELKRKEVAAAEELRRKQEKDEKRRKANRAEAMDRLQSQAGAGDGEAGTAEKKSGAPGSVCELYIGKTVKSNTSFPDIPGNPVVTVRIRLTPSRMLKEVKVESPSENPEFDSQIERGIRKSGQFPAACPEDFTYVHLLKPR